VCWGILALTMPVDSEAYTWGPTLIFVDLGADSISMVWAMSGQG
jgi:hypothetical protein